MKLSEFDFRIWDKDEKCFLDPYTKSRAVVKDLPNEKLLNLEIELFTGLYDNNNNKIYEGDIISIYVSGDFINYTVVYNKDKASFVAIVDDYEEDFTFYSDIEVIGNIHENEEILKNTELLK
ncbi:YopX family protein [Campylobacter coli]